MLLCSVEKVSTWEQVPMRIYNPLTLPLVCSYARNGLCICWFVFIKPDEEARPPKNVKFLELRGPRSQAPNTSLSSSPLPARLTGVAFPVTSMTVTCHLV